MLDTVINPGIVRQLTAMGGKAEGIPGKRVLLAKKLPPQTEGRATAVDLGFAGEVCDVNLEAVDAALTAGAIPVLSPLAQDADGTTLNINADTAAGTVAARLQASKMIYLSDVPGLMRDPLDKQSLIPSVNRAKIEHLMEEEIIAGGMIPKVEFGPACARGRGEESALYRRPHAARAAGGDLHRHRHRDGDHPVACRP